MGFNVIFPGVGLYLTYEELKQGDRKILNHRLAGLYLTYEELKQVINKIRNLVKPCLYLTYEELKLGIGTGFSLVILSFISYL